MLDKHPNIILINFDQDQTKFINNLFEKLPFTEKGKKLYNKLLFYLKFNYIIYIIDSVNSIEYDTKLKIVLPSNYNNLMCQTLNFTKTIKMGENYIANKSSIDKLISIGNHEEQYFILQKCEITKFQDMIELYHFDIFFLFINQLIKLIRILENKNLANKNLEDYSVLYGIKGLSLKINDDLITENSIREEYDIPARISENILYF